MENPSSTLLRSNSDYMAADAPFQEHQPSERVWQEPERDYVRSFDAFGVLNGSRSLFHHGSMFGPLSTSGWATIDCDVSVFLAYTFFPVLLVFALSCYRHGNIQHTLSCRYPRHHRTGGCRSFPLVIFLSSYQKIASQIRLLLFLFVLFLLPRHSHHFNFDHGSVFARSKLVNIKTSCRGVSHLKDDECVRSLNVSEAPRRRLLPNEATVGWDKVVFTDMLDRHTWSYITITSWISFQTMFIIKITAKTAQGLTSSAFEH